MCPPFNPFNPATAWRCRWMPLFTCVWAFPLFWAEKPDFVNQFCGSILCNDSKYCCGAVLMNLFDMMSKCVHCTIRQFLDKSVYWWRPLLTVLRASIRSSWRRKTQAKMYAEPVRISAAYFRRYTALSEAPIKLDLNQAKMYAKPVRISAMYFRRYTALSEAPIKLELNQAKMYAKPVRISATYFRRYTALSEGPIKLELNSRMCLS